MGKQAITIDCRMIDSSGVGSYLRGIIPYFLKSNNALTLLGNSKKILSFFPGINVPILECNITPFTIKDQFFFDKKILKIINNTDIYFSPFFNIPHGIKIPVYTTIHDIVFPDIKSISSCIGLGLRMVCYRRAYRVSKKIFTVSIFSKSRIEYHLGNKKPVIVTYESINDKFYEFRKKSNNIKKKEDIVFIGNIKKHKGLDTLIDAFLQAKSEGLPHNLIFIGNINKLRTTNTSVLKRIRSLNCSSIKLTGFISDEELMDVLSSASLLVHPSLYEGFGLPPLEALVLGTSALISDIPVFKEIYKDYPITFFKTGDCNDLKTKLLELLYNKEPSVPELSVELLSKYSFEKTTSIILKELQ